MPQVSSLHTLPSLDVSSGFLLQENSRYASPASVGANAAAVAFSLAGSLASNK